MKELSNDLQKYYEKYTRGIGGVCSYLIEGEKTEDNQPNQPCHASLYPGGWNRPPPGLHSVHLVIRRSNDDTKDYVEWICGPKSPWAKLLESAKVYRDNKGFIIGVSIHDVQKQNHDLVMNFAFASRIHDEFWGQARFKLFIAAREHGLSHAQAAVVSQAFSGKPDQMTKSVDGSWHTFLAPEIRHPISVRRLENADPILPKVLFTPGARRDHNLLNSMWNEPKDVPKVHIYNLVSNFTNRPVYSGNFNRMATTMKDTLKITVVGKDQQWAMKDIVEQQKDWYV